MRLSGLRAFYFEAFPIDKLSPYDIPVSRTGGVKTGGMGAKEFQKLTSSIAEKGLINPVIVEDDNTKLKVAMGNNRVWAIKTLGGTHIKAIVITKNNNPAPEPGDEEIPLKYFEDKMKTLHPGDMTWKHSPYARQIRRHNRQLKTPEN